jgi:2-dehydropantoate 2-reductase
MSASETLVIWGAGAIGGTIGAHLARAGQDVLMVDRVAEHVEAIGKSGLTITGPISAFTTAARACLPDDLRGTYRRVLLCVKSQDTADAVKAIIPYLAPNGYIASFQNGLNEPVIAEIAGPARTMGAFINFASDYISLGTIHYGNRGAVVVGEIDGRITSRAETLHRQLKAFDEDAVLTDNIYGYLWSKQAYASLLKASALTNASMADVLDSKVHRDALAALVREIVAAAHANGVVLKPFDAFDPAAFTPQSGSAALSQCFDAMVAYNRRSAKTHSGIWRDIAVRKRRTEVPAQLTPVIRMGRQKAVDMTLVEKLVDLFREVEDGLRPQGWETLDALKQAHEKTLESVLGDGGHR